MKSFFKIFAIVLIVINVPFYLITIKEGQDVLGKKSYLIGNIFQSFEYYAKWVIPYWWFIIILVCVALTFTALGIKKHL